MKTEIVKGKKHKEEEDSNDDENLSLMIKNQFNKVRRRRIKGYPQFSNDMDVEKLDISKHIA